MRKGRESLKLRADLHEHRPQDERPLAERWAWGKRGVAWRAMTVDAAHPLFNRAEKRFT